MKTKVRGRILAILMSLAMAFTMMLMVEGEAYADSDKEDTIGGVKYTLTFDNAGNGTVSVTGCDSDLGGEVEILDKVKFNGIEYPVTSIAGNSLAFKNFTSISIPASVKSIGGSAFQYCESLGTVTFAANSQLESIGEDAFYYCKSLKTVTFASNSQLESIGGGAFQGTAITSISIPASVTSIGVGAFNMTAITSISIPAGVKSIGEYAFYYCKSLKTVTFASNSQLESIGEGTFQGTAITSISIPASVKSIGGSAFKGTAITSISIPASVKSIGRSAFKGTAITSISIPASVTSIGESAFDGCSNLGTVVFASNSQLESIGGSAFEGTAITSISIPASVTNIGGYAFNCGTLNTVYYVGTEEQWRGIIDLGWDGNRGISVVFVKGVAYAPSGKTLTYNGEEQTGVATGEGYTLIGESKTNAGSYTATATLEEGYVWSDGKTDPKEIIWKINKAAAKVTPPAGKTFTYNGKAQTGVAAGTGYSLTGTTKATKAGTYEATATLKADTNYAYKWSDGTTTAKTITWTINKAAAKVIPPVGKTFTYNGKAQTGVAAGTGYSLTGTTKATKAGTYEATATLKTDTNYSYKWSDGTSTAKSITWSINKAANPLTIKAKTATVKYSKVKKKAQILAIGKVITFTKKGQGKMTYKLVSAKKGKKNLKKKFKINSKTGKVTVKKGLKKGDYKVKVKARAASNANYNASAWKTVTLKITVK